MRKNELGLAVRGYLSFKEVSIFLVLLAILFDGVELFK